jgi:uncharacterized protein (TIGR02001 family)
MKRVAFGCALGLIAAGSLAPAHAADIAADAAVAAVVAEAPALFDVAFGVAGLSDYRFRGVSQTSKDPAVQGYVELKAFDWLYAGIWSSSVSFPSRFGLTDPSAEVDFYAGVRHSWGAFSLDAGGLYYWYPGETKTFPGQKQTDYWELKAVPTVAFGSYGSLTGNIWWSSDYANTGSNELYLSLVPRVNIPVSALPNLGFYVSAELGKQWLKKSETGFNPADFWTWNVGGGFTYKAMTLDLRYSDTNLSRADCFGNTGARSWCGSTVIGKIAFDTSLNSLK